MLGVKNVCLLLSKFDKKWQKITKNDKNWQKWPQKIITNRKKGKKWQKKGINRQKLITINLNWQQKWQKT